MVNIPLHTDGPDMNLVEQYVKENMDLFSKNILEAFPTKSTKYILTGTAENGCSNSIEIQVRVNPKPQFEILGDEEVCENSPISLTASGDGETYYWSTGSASYDKFVTNNNVALNIPINQPTFVFVKGIDEHGCENVAQKSIKTINPPELSYRGNVEVCEGEKIELTGEGAKNYRWKLGNKYSTDNPFVFEPNITDKVTLIGTLGKCSSELEIETRIKPSPKVIISGDSATCRNDFVTLTADGAVRYIWSTGEQTKSITKKIANTNSYTVTGYSSNGCSNSVSKIVKARDIPKISADYSRKGCPETGTIVSLIAKGANSLVWESNPDNNDIDDVPVTPSDVTDVTIFETTRFVVTGTDDFGCVNTDTLTVEPLTFEQMEYDITPRIIDSDNRVVGFLGIKPITQNWTWITGDEIEPIRGKDVNFTYTAVTQDSFEVKIIAVDDSGCEYKDTAFIYVWKDFWAPSAFTPNEDNLNDEFRFKGTEYMTEFEFRIFDRLGTVVFEGYSKDDAWDGTFKGEPCPWGVYGYVVKYRSNYKGLEKEGERRGEITLIR